jgi:hypothetical protein
MKNIDIRQAIEKADIKYWQVAEKLNLNDGNFSRKLRREFPPEEKDKIFKIIEELKNERGD